jgi:hypothetical protein
MKLAGDALGARGRCVLADLPCRTDGMAVEASLDKAGQKIDFPPRPTVAAALNCPLLAEDEQLLIEAQARRCLMSPPPAGQDGAAGFGPGGKRLSSARPGP